MSERHPTRNGIVATVVGGLILAGLSAVSGPVRKLVGDISRLLQATYALPGWALLILGLAAVWIIARLIKFFSSKSTASSQSVPVAQTDPLAMLCDRLLGELAREDGNPVHTQALQRRWSESSVRIEAAMDELQRKNLIEVLRPDSGETIMLLTSRGKREVVTRRLV